MNRRSFLKRCVATAAGLAVGASAAEALERMAEAPLDSRPVPNHADEPEQFLAVVDAATGAHKGMFRVVAIDRQAKSITVAAMDGLSPGDHLIFTHA